MNTEKMTVHRALAELKTLDSRIHKAIQSAKYCAAVRHNDGKIEGVTVEEYKRKIKSDFQSVKSMINRRNAMKRAVVLSNAKTDVEIAGQTYRVAEAIEMKNHGMENYIFLANAIAQARRAAMMELDRNNGQYLEKKATDYVIAMYGGKENVGTDEAKAAMENYINANTFDLIDPMNVAIIQDEIEKYVSDFMSEIDAALSVSNALTEIEFSYEAE